ncbi:MFS transporter [Amedibacillus sp. YH-ame6]
MKLLKNRNFSLMILGQIISLFGNSILRFSISLYILEESGSAAIFATILSISILPTILLSPIGGILADRVSRKHIMLVLDFITSAIIFGFSLFALQGNVPIFIIATVMILLSIIQACYQPSVQSSVPLLVESNELVTANGLVVQINALSTLLGPILGGILFSFIPFPNLLWIAAGSFFFSAIIECIMKIPYQRMERKENVIKTSLSDIKEGMHFIMKVKPTLFGLLIILALLNMVLSSLLTVGLPVISNITLQLPPIFYGWLEASIAIGSIVGSIALSVFFKKTTIKESYKFLLFGSIAVSLIGVALLFKDSAYMSYALVLFASVLSMAFAAIFNILAQTYLQQATPEHLLGKVSSFVTMIVMCSYPIGQSLYGYFFEVFSDQQFFIIFIASILSIIISLQTKRKLKDI